MSRPKFQSTIWVTGGRYHTSAADIILMSTFIALISIITLPAVVTAELLQFGPDALPHCAYDCVPLWSAQYECQMETVPGACFCKSSYLVPLLRGDGSSVCEAICPEGQGGAEVRSWFERVCVAFMGQPGNPQEDPSTGNPPKEDPNNPNDDPKNPDGDGGGKDSDTKNPGLDLGPNQAEKAIDWWKNNWYWFLLAFLFITIPLTAYALFFPCRKWARKQIIMRRSRRPLPPLDPATLNVLGVNNYADGGLYSPSPGPPSSVPPVPDGVFNRWGEPYTPIITRIGAYAPLSYHGGSDSGIGVADSTGPGSSASVYAHGSGVGSSRVVIGPEPVRQGSWERKVREEFEGKKTVGERLSFWRRSNNSAEGQEKSGV